MCLSPKYLEADSAQNKVSRIFLKSLSRSRNTCPISGSPGMGQKDIPLLMIEIWLSVSIKSDILSTRFSGTRKSILLLFGLLFKGLLTITLNYTKVLPRLGSSRSSMNFLFTAWQAPRDVLSNKGLQRYCG